MKRKVFNSLTLVSVIFFVSSCSSYLDINRDPAVPQTTDAVNILPPMLAQMVRGEVFDTRYIGRYIQNFSANTGGDDYERHGYAPGSDAMGEKWRSHYWSIGKNVDLAITDATPKRNFDIVGAAKAIRAWSWQSTTDYHGEMILKEAWEPNRYIFDFDTQDQIYAEVVRLCNEALGNLDDKTGVARLALGDAVYKGNTDKWKRFIYGILARNAHHISNKKSLYKPDDVIKLCDLSLQSNDDNFGVPHNASSSLDANFYGVLRNNIGSYRATTTIIKLLDGTTFSGVKDPRLPIMFAASPDTVWRGITPFSSDPNNTLGNTKRIPNLWGQLPTGTYTGTGRWIYDDKALHYLMTYAEILFIKSEAQFIKGDKAGSLDTYKKAIAAHCDFCGVSSANKATLLASAVIPASADVLALSDIMQQKYIALYFHGAVETWVDMRRYRYSSAIYTTFVQPTGTFIYPDNNGKLAYRVRPRYNSEYVWNRASLDVFGGNKSDYHTFEPWFMQP